MDQLPPLVDKARLCWIAYSNVVSAGRLLEWTTERVRAAVTETERDRASARHRSAEKVLVDARKDLEAAERDLREAASA